MMNEMMMVIVAAIFAGMMTEWKPRFEVRDAPSGLNPINWFNLKNGTMATVRIKQLYFGVGQEFMDAGFMIPAGCHDRLLCLVVAEGEIEVETANKGVQRWFTTLITQGVVGDLYREAVQMRMGGQLEDIPEKDLMDTPNGLDLGLSMDAFRPSGAFAPQFTISHEQHPTNPTRSLYKMLSMTPV